MKKLFAVFMASLLAVGMAGCSKPAPTETDKPQEDVTITVGYWGDSGETDAYMKAIEGVEDVVPGVKVKLQHYPGGADFWNALPGQIAAGTAPDIIAPTNENHIGYINDGLMLSLDEFNFDLDGYAQNSIDAWTYNGKLYGIPMTASPAVFAINKGMWKTAGLTDYPKTWEEVYTAAKKLKESGVEYPMIIDLSQGYHATQYVNSFGGGWKNGTDINSKANEEALTYIFKMYKEGLAVNPKDEGLSWDGEVFAANKAAMTTAGTWYIGFMKESAPDIEYDLAPVPSVDGTKAGTLHSNALTVLKDTKNLELAAKVAYYMSREESQKAYANIVGGVPAREALTEGYYIDNPKMATIRETAAAATSFGYPVDSTRFQADFVLEMEKVLYENNGDYTDTTAAEILARLAEKYETK